MQSEVSENLLKYLFISLVLEESKENLEKSKRNLIKFQTETWNAKN